MYPRAREFFDIIAAEPGLTERQIAERAGLKKTPYSRRILLDLISGGHVGRCENSYADRTTYIYFVQGTEAMFND
jgi:hypothetical protein